MQARQVDAEVGCLELVAQLVLVAVAALW
jgi:hypothetical protein